MRDFIGFRKSPQLDPALRLTRSPRLGQPGGRSRVCVVISEYLSLLWAERYVGEHHTEDFPGPQELLCLNL